MGTHRTLKTGDHQYSFPVMNRVSFTPAQATLTEGKAVTGNREVKSQPQVGLDNILDIRKLAGLK